MVMFEQYEMCEILYIYNVIRASMMIIIIIIIIIIRHLFMRHISSHRGHSEAHYSLKHVHIMN